MAAGVDPNDIYHNGYYYNRVTGGGLASLDSVALKQMFVDYTNTGTVGNVTINKASGRVNAAPGAVNITVTNSLVTAASKIFTQIATNDTAALLKNAVPSAGSFIITFYASPSAQTAVDFFVVNAD